MVRLHMNSGATMRYSNFRKDESSGEAFFIKVNILITQERLKELVSYCSVTGVFTKRSITSTRIKIGTNLGWPDKKGYMRVMLDSKTYSIHRLAWLFCYGSFPSSELDHIDGDKSNNAISNLREVSRTENQQNLRRATSRNLSGYLGVVRKHGKFGSEININGTRVWLGYFKSAELAHFAYLEAKRKHHLGCTI